MFAKNTLQRASTLVVAVILCAALCVAQDRNPPAATGEALGAEDLHAVLKQAAQTQGVLAQLSAEFQVTYAVNLPEYTEARGTPPRHLAYNDGVADAMMKWLRDETAERVETLFDRPDEFKSQHYEDFVVVDDGQSQIHYLPRTRQVAIVPAGGLACRAPTGWLLPAFHKTFGELRSDPNVQKTEAFRTDDEKIVVRVQKRMGPNNAPTVNCMLAPDLDYAVVRWTVPAWGTDVELKYNRDADGRVVPAEATLRVFKEGRELRRDTLRSVSFTPGPPDADLLEFEFEPGMLIADNRPDEDGSIKVELYRVKPSGEFEQLRAH